ncbi:MAG: efflux RND transporter periplasmic adaptor subunit [Myxococcota bacterium]
MWIRRALCVLVWICGATDVRAQSAFLVATQSVAPAPHELTLPTKVGVLEPHERRRVAFEVAGRLVELAEKAAPVRAGEVLARLDDALDRAQLRQAEVHLADAQRALRRLEALRRSRVTSEKALEDARSALQLAEAEREAAAERLARKTLRAPWDGVLSERFRELGEVVDPGVPVATFIDTSRLRVEVDVPAFQIGRVRTGQRAWIELPAFAGERFAGRVRKVAPAPAEGRHLFSVEVELSDPDPRLRPGLSARVEIVTAILERAMVIPLAAVVERGRERVVFFAADGRAHRHEVSEARVHGDRLVIEEPPPYRDLIVRGQHALHDGDLLRIDNSVLLSQQRP